MTNQKIAFIVDSCGDLDLSLAQKYHIFVLPLLVEHDGKSYRDLIDINRDEVYELQNHTTLKTSSPLGSDIYELFEKIEKEGYTHVIGCTFSSKLSGTHNQLSLIANTFENLECRIIDTTYGSIAQGALACELAKLYEQGASYEMLLERADFILSNTHIFISIDRLDLLEKGGRIGKVAATIGTLVKIKPILTLKDGVFEVVSKVRGAKKVGPKLIDLLSAVMDENQGRRFVLLVAEGAMQEQVDGLLATLKEKYPNFEDVYYGHIGCTLSIHVGPGLMGVGVYFLD